MVHFIFYRADNELTAMEDHRVISTQTVLSDHEWYHPVSAKSLIMLGVGYQRIRGSTDLLSLLLMKVSPSVAGKISEEGDLLLPIEFTLSNKHLELV